MVSLAESAQQPPREDPRSKCGPGEWINALPPAEREGGNTLLGQVTTGERRLSEVFELFRENGFPYQYNALGKHRRGMCSCRR